jgi:hypothetical protein
MKHVYLKIREIWCESKRLINTGNYSMRLELLTNAIVVDDAIRSLLEHTNSKHNMKNYQKEGEEG